MVNELLARIVNKQLTDPRPPAEGNQRDDAGLQEGAPEMRRASRGWQGSGDDSGIALTRNARAPSSQPYAIVMRDRSLFGFAGLWERWKDKASGEFVRSFTIITTTPNEVCAPIHNRMPVIVDPANYGKWLGEEAVDPVRLLSLLKPFPAEQMECYPVGTAVG